MARQVNVRTSQKTVAEPQRIYLPTDTVFEFFLIDTACLDRYRNFRLPYLWETLMDRFFSECLDDPDRYGAGGPP